MYGPRPGAYADEMAWRENHRRQPNGTHWNLITAAALARRQDHAISDGS
jgi:hypothetical protein